MIQDNSYKQTDSFISAGWKRNLLFVSIAQFIAMIGMSSVIPFMPFFVKELGITSPDEASIWSGLIFAGPYFLSIITTPLWGAMGDKYGMKLMIVRAVFGLFTAVFLMGFVQNVYQLFALRVFQGAVSGMIAAALAFVAANTPTDKAGYAIGILQSSLSAGNIIGPFAGGLISDFAGIRSVFIIVSVMTFMAGLLVLIFVKENKKGKDDTRRTSITENLKFVYNNKSIRFVLILIILSQAGINYTNPIFPFYIETLNAPPKFISTITGSLLAIVGLMSIIFAPIWGKRNDRKDYRKTVRISSLVISAAAFAHIVVNNYLLLFPVRALAGIFFAAVLPTLYSALNKVSPVDSKGGVMGIASSANLVGTLIGYTTCGYVASLFNLEMPFIISGILMLSVALLIFNKERN
ncbi:MAG: MFS transporter [Candidatus Kapaibacterium sp.]|nr:MFS transporter [Candidatus Kapabacteria bacterium]